MSSKVTNSGVPVPYLGKKTLGDLGSPLPRMGMGKVMEKGIQAGPVKIISVGIALLGYPN